MRVHVNTTPIDYGSERRGKFRNPVTPWPEDSQTIVYHDQYQYLVMDTVVENRTVGILYGTSYKYRPLESSYGIFTVFSGIPENRIPVFCFGISWYSTTSNNGI